MTGEQRGERERLRGRTALVTGASRGIGLAIARALASDGARVAMLARGEQALRAAAADIGSLAIPLSCDVTDAAAVERVAGSVRDEFGGAPDVIVNNAGLFELARVEDTRADAFVRALDVNLLAPFLVARSFLGAMRARGSGHIVNIGSSADHTALPENGAYAASKWGLRALHQVLLAELRGTGVRVTLVSPGPTDTPLWDAITTEGRPGFTPRSRMLSADAVADAVRFAVVQPDSVTVEEIRIGRS